MTTKRVALVTGASRGIGAACARRLAADDWAVAIHYRARQEAAEAVVSDILRAGGTAHAFQADLSNPDTASPLIAATLAHFDRLDLLVNNAAVAAGAALEDIDRTDIERHFSTNVTSLLLLTQAAVAAFTAGGSIINISSINAAKPPAGASVYAASKAAVEAITRALAAELGPRDIRVNSVAPGATDTDMLRGAHGDAVEALVKPLTVYGRRLGRPEDIAAVVAFLASPQSGWITGQVINASGGLQI